MLEKTSRKILDLIVSSEQSDEHKEVLLFGITRIVEDIPKTIGIIIIGLLLGILKEMLIVTIVIAVYKSSVGGVHAKTNSGCFFYSVLFYLATIYSAKYFCFSGEIKDGAMYILIYLFAIYTIILYVPADVPEIPKVNKKLRNKMKIRSVVSLNVMYLLSSFVIKDTAISTLIVYSIFYINLMTTRIIYKLFKNEYGFETYAPDELI